LVQICEEQWIGIHAIEDVQTRPHGKNGGLLWTFDELTNNLQIKTTNSFLTTMFKFDLQPNLRITTIGCKHIKRNHEIQG
jgi:hypothetical protein